MSGRQPAARSNAPVYEDFQPKSELKEEQGAQIQLIQLPDFSKEHVRVIYVHSTRTVRVQGERPLGNNKWSRFNRTFPVPQNCIADKIHGKFQDGMLIITMPKQTISTQQPAPAPTQEGKKIAPKEKEPSSVAAPHPPPRVPSSAAAPPPKEPPSVVAPPPKLPIPAQLPTGEATGKDQKSSPASHTPEKPITEPKAQKGQEKGDTSAKTTAKQSTEIEDTQTKDKEKRVDDSAPSKAPYEPKSQKQDETPETEKQRKTEIVKKSDETAEIAAPSGEKGKVKEEISFVEKAKEMKSLAVERMKTALEKKEDRQMMVNMGVAVLVIVAVGAYVTYKIRSSAKAKD